MKVFVIVAMGSSRLHNPTPPVPSETNAHEIAVAQSLKTPADGATSPEANQHEIPLSTRLLYWISILASISTWLFPIRAPLWLDETLAYWQVSGGFAKIWSRSALMPSSIGYLYTLWLAKSILGTSEIALKIPSTLALVAATYFLFRAAREIFDVETSFLACIFFALDANVVFAATDARPYAFALLATNLATFAFVRWIKVPQIRYAVLFGAASAAILYYHYLFAAVLPAFAIYYFIARGRFLKSDLRQIISAFASFALLCIPLIYRVASLYHTRQSHVVPELSDPFKLALHTIAPELVWIGFVVFILIALLLRKIRLPGRENLPYILLGPLLFLVPAGIFFAVRAVAGVHLVIPRYLTVWAPGIALTWAVLTSCIASNWFRRLFFVGLVAIMLYHSIRSPFSRWHQLNFKEAHALVNANLAENREQDKGPIPVLVSSAFIESDYEPLPTDMTSENALVSQVAYYPINSPIVMLPMNLNDNDSDDNRVNDEAVQIGTQTIAAAEQKHRRFLMVVPPISYSTARWFDQHRHTLSSHVLGDFHGILVLEFRPSAER